MFIYKYNRCSSRDGEYCQVLTHRFFYFLPWYDVMSHVETEINDNSSIDNGGTGAVCFLDDLESL